MKHLISYKIFENLVNSYLDTIQDKINNGEEESMVIAMSGSFRFYLENHYPNRLKEYLYRISDGENIKEVILDISKNMTRDDEIGRYLHDIIEQVFPKYNVTCISSPRGYDITVGNKYIIVDEYIDDGRELVELEYNDSGEPLTIYYKDYFIKSN